VVVAHIHSIWGTIYHFVIYYQLHCIAARLIDHKSAADGIGIRERGAAGGRSEGEFPPVNQRITIRILTGTTIKLYRIPRADVRDKLSSISRWRVI